MTNDKKNRIIVALLVTVVFMTIGFALVTAKIDFDGRTSLTEIFWDVKITNIVSIDTEESGSYISHTNEGKTTLKLNTLLKEKGDKVTYVINVLNDGTIDAILDNIDISSKDDDVIYSIENIEAGETLKKGESKQFIITAYFNEEKEVKEAIKEMKIHLDYIQK